MKTVFANRQVAHVWAQQNQPEGRSHNGNFWFEGATLYSYSTPIARFVEAPNGKRVCLITSESFSPTTAGKHIAPAWRAVDHKAFGVPFLSFGDIYSGRGPRAPSEEEAHKLNLAHLVEQYTSIVTRYLKSRNFWGTRNDLVKRLDELATSAREYAETFKLEMPALDVDGDAQRIWERFERLKSDPKRIAREAAKKARQEEEERLRALADAEKLAEWLQGADVRFYSPTVHLRVKGDKLQTSMGAEVPLAHAIRVFRFVRACRERGQEWHRNGTTIRVGLFVLDSVDTQGNFRAGCHSITWEECERLARQIGVFDDATPSEEALEPSHAAA
jgi:cell fate (sporulation/competence/biofilm development) regulator YlbF (YheA/YmcA/DUF963 family)